MKKYLSLMAMLMLGMLAFTACGDDDDDDAPAPANLKTNILYVTFSDGKTAELEIVGIGGNANNLQSAEENHFTFYEGPCDIHLDCNFKTGNGTGDIELVDQRILDESTKQFALEYPYVYGEYKATNCRWVNGILYYHLEGSGSASKESGESIKCTFKADVKQTGTIYFPQQ